MSTAAKELVTVFTAFVMCATGFVPFALAETDHGANCDALGAYEFDPLRASPAVHDEDVDVDALVDACRKAIDLFNQSNPDTLARYRTQFLRGLILQGDHSQINAYERKNTLDQNYPGQLHLIATYYHSTNDELYVVQATGIFFRCARTAKVHLDCSYMAGKLLLENYNNASFTKKPTIVTFEELLSGPALHQYKNSDLYLVAAYMLFAFDESYVQLIDRLDFVIDVLAKYTDEKQPVDVESRSIAYALSALYMLRTLPDEDHSILVEELIQKSRNRSPVVDNTIIPAITELLTR